MSCLCVCVQEDITRCLQEFKSRGANFLLAKVDLMVRTRKGVPLLLFEFSVGTYRCCREQEHHDYVRVLSMKWGMHTWTLDYAHANCEALLKFHKNSQAREGHTCTDVLMIHNFCRILLYPRGTYGLYAPTSSSKCEMLTRIRPRSKSEYLLAAST